MKFTPVNLLAPLMAFLTLTRAQDNSQLFIQIIGASTAATPTDATVSPYFTICTNYIHGLVPASILPQTSEVAQLDQIQADGVCEFCTSLGQSRVDSCCSQSTSVECFFGDSGKAQATSTTAPASNAATVTATGTGVGSTAAATTSTKKSYGGRVDVNIASFAPIVLAIAACTL